MLVKSQLYNSDIESFTLLYEPQIGQLTSKIKLSTLRSFTLCEFVNQNKLH
jgi:hypothetical protein